MEYLIRVDLCSTHNYNYTDKKPMWQIPHSSNYKECVYVGSKSWPKSKPSIGCADINVAYARLAIIDVDKCCKKMLEVV